MYELLSEDGRAAGAPPEAIDRCERSAGILFPDEYRAFLALSNGFNGQVGHGYLTLWSVPELAELADGYDVYPLRRHCFLIGSNGGPTGYGLRHGDYISMPFVAAGDPAEEIHLLGTSLPSFIEAIARGEGA